MGLLHCDWLCRLEHAGLAWSVRPGSTWAIASRASLVNTLECLLVTFVLGVGTHLEAFTRHNMSFAIYRNEKNTIVCFVLLS